jgi:hypothetical protein
MEKAVVGLIASLGIIGAIATKTSNKVKDAETFISVLFLFTFTFLTALDSFLLHPLKINAVPATAPTPAAFKNFLLSINSPFLYFNN